ncbi:hypothetical protein ABW22_05940 [Thiobacillus denitrificans]|uniref:Uncharacterized protein n=1 Tax=Thiobacillus denitrificans TaxID=36861 RepID=A0A106BQV4_THIDE|nr:hypothetical protein ABW22_05940 [Thiobacillus denitrificans]
MGVWLLTIGALFRSLIVDGDAIDILYKIFHGVFAVDESGLKKFQQERFDEFREVVGIMSISLPCQGWLERPWPRRSWPRRSWAMQR